MRDLTIRIRAEVKDAMRGLQKVKQGVTDFNKEVAKSSAKRDHINKIGDGFLKVGIAAGVGTAMAVRAFANFDQGMSSVKATGADAAKNIDALTKAAIDAGQATKFSATEAASAVENLAKAGVSSADILGGGLSGSLDLAAAGMIPVADAAEYASIALTQFKLKGADVPHVADLLAAGAGKANGEVSDLAGALNQSGLVAAQMGLSIEETTGSLAAFASAGLLGSDAGTSLKTMLLRLQNPAKESADLMKKLGISAYDAQGNFVGMADLSGQLSTAFEGQTQSTRDAAMAQIFGSDAIRAANVLYNQGSKGIKDWTKKVDDSGYAAETAATKMDNLKGDWEQLTGSLETALIGTGSGANSPLRNMTQDVTGLVNAYSELPAPIKSGMLQMMALTTVIGLGGFAASRAVTGYGRLSAAITTSGRAAEGAQGKYLAMRGGAMAAGVGLLAFSSAARKSGKDAEAMTTVLGAAAIGFSLGGPWGAAIGAAGGAVKLFMGAQAEAAKKVSDLSGTLDQQTGALTKNTSAMIANNLEKSGANKIARSIGLDPKLLVKSAKGDHEAAKGIQDHLNLAFAANSGHGGKDPNDPTGPKLDSPGDKQNQQRILKLSRLIGDETTAVEKMNAAWKEQDDMQRQVAHGMLGAKVDGVAKSLEKATGEATKYQDAFKKIPAKVQTDIKQNGAKASSSSIKTLAKLYGLTPKEVRTILKAQDKAKPKIDAVGKAIKDVNGDTAQTYVRVDGADYAIGQVHNLKSALQSFANNYNATATVGIMAPPHATGGPIVGPGTGTSDSIMTPMSNGEHVWTAAEVQAAGGQGAMYQMRAAVLAGRQGFAVGGDAGVPLAAKRRARMNQSYGAKASAAAPQPAMAFSASIAGAEIAVSKDGLISFVRGQIDVVQSGNDNYKASKSRAGGRRP